MTPNNLPYRIRLRTISDVTHLNFASPYAQGLRACQCPPHLPTNTITIPRNQLKIDKSTSFSPVAPPQCRQGNQVFEYR
ncbi:hypothetical protein PILCRDRAFT_814363 [Piloderma croceum F 1598]|uniref:Uncharacterized protein n=1 Tax=Piloderma croceum (strain F 1598) TaxID=765440 RepID=A0A0C3CFD8_PILCF|nr:hypothetical protein PILCRDRAFT_814363 [Piloderma croceum F 1598]